MPTLLILSREADEYQRLIHAAQLPDLELTSEPARSNIVLGEPKLIQDSLPRLTSLKWAQAIYAGVEPLVNPGQRRDYILTNARGVFGELMSEYVFGYLLFHEKKILERIQAQQALEWQRPESGRFARQDGRLARSRFDRRAPGRNCETFRNDSTRIHPKK